MAYYFNEEWLQEVVSSIELPALSSSVARVVLPVVEMQIKKLLQQSHKFQRRGKKKYLTVEDFNMALSVNRIEPVYGLISQNQHTSMTASATAESQSTNPSPFKKIKLADVVKRPLPHYPLKPDLSLHWLAVQGVQPAIPENPTVTAPSLLATESATMTTGDTTDKTTAHVTHLTSTISASAVSLISLPKEMQLVYTRIIKVLEGGSIDNSNNHHHNNTTNTNMNPTSEATLRAVYDALLTDPGMQILVPHICLFIYTKVRDPSRSLDLLQRLVRAVKSLVLNPHINLEYHLQQLLPAIFTCIVSSQHFSPSTKESYYYYTTTNTGDKKGINNKTLIWAMTSSVAGNMTVPTTSTQNIYNTTSYAYTEDDNWSLRQSASEIISLCCSKYANSYPELQAQVVKTYIEALGPVGLAGGTVSSDAAITQKSLSTLYGAIAGLSTLGTSALAVGQVLLPRLAPLLQRLSQVESTLIATARDICTTTTHATNASITTTTATSATSFKMNKYSEYQLQLSAWQHIKQLLVQVLGSYMAYELKSLSTLKLSATPSYRNSAKRKRNYRNITYNQSQGLGIMRETLTSASGCGSEHELLSSVTEAMGESACIYVASSVGTIATAEYYNHAHNSNYHCARLFI